jgi:excisionase family DNA binding protein
MSDHFETVKAFMAETLTIDQTAEHFNVSRLTVTRWLKSGKLKGDKIGRDWRITKDEIERYHRDRV